MNDLFDIAHANALEIISIEEDRLFLEAQEEKERRTSYISTIDNELIVKQIKKRKRDDCKVNQVKQELIKKNEYQVVELVSSSSRSSDEPLRPGPSKSFISKTSKKR